MMGIQYPIIQGAFAHGGTSAIASAVSDAGGLGIITSIAFKSPQAFREDIMKAKSETSKPFGVNFTLWKGVIDNAYQEPYVKAAIDEGVKIAFTSGYDGSFIGALLKEAGCLWIHKCATLNHAVKIAEKGADAVVIVGREGTGYKNDAQNTTLINITVGRRRINIPLIAAGGIGDARGLVAALSMGASGIYMGTAFMATKEYPAPEKFKQQMVKRDVSDSKFIQKILNMDHGASPSLACGVIQSIPTVKEFIETMIREAYGVIEELKSSIS